MPNHLISTNVNDFPVLHKYRDQLEGRSMIVRKLKILPVEAIVRGYISGTAVVCDFISLSKTNQVQR